MTPEQLQLVRDLIEEITGYFGEPTHDALAAIVVEVERLTVENAALRKRLEEADKAIRALGPKDLYEMPRKMRSLFLRYAAEAAEATGARVTAEEKVK